jgi:hypothetical protein
MVTKDGNSVGTGDARPIIEQEVVGGQAQLLREQAVAVYQHGFFICERDDEHQHERNDAERRIDPEEDIDQGVGRLRYIGHRALLAA